MKIFLRIIIVCVVLLPVFYVMLFPQAVYAETSIYRSAGWVATDGSPAYSNTTGCQTSNDGLYCSRVNASSYGNLYFSSFGNLEDFGIPSGSFITKLHIRIKGKNSAAQYVSVNSAKNYKPFLAACNTPGDLWAVYLGGNDNVIEKHTFTSSNGLTTCITASNIDQERLTFRLNLSSGSSLSADIDNFEIAFDYNLPTYSWKIQGISNIPRNLNQSVLLDNGKVLIAGGVYVAQSTNIVEIFTPGSNGIGAWTHANRMNHDRKLHTLHSIYNQQANSMNVIAIGGAAEGCSCIRNSAELYNPSTNTWTMMSNLNSARAFHGSSVFGDGKVLVSGGIKNTGNTIQNSTEAYDVATNTWTLKTPLNVARAYHRQITFTDPQGNSKAMVIGGRDASGNQLASTEIYDLSSNAWILGPDMNSARYYDFSAITLHDGRILVVGGNTTGGSEVYDPTTNQWTTFPTSYDFRQGSIVELGRETNYKVLAAGSFPVTTNAMLFDPQTNLWTNTASMNSPRADFTLTLLKDGTALAANGISSYQQTHTSEIYVPSAIIPPPTPTPTPKTPLILIPGIGGSEFKSNEAFISDIKDCGILPAFSYNVDDVVWVNAIKAGISSCDDYFDVLKLKTDGQTPEYSKVILSGNLFEGAYGNTIKFFEAFGYELGKTLFLFPYDWRKDVFLTAPLLDQKIISVKTQTGSDKVDIVAHSMGGLVARNYISDSLRAQNVRKLFTLGTPHLGAVDFLKNLRFGGCLTQGFWSDIADYGICLGISPTEVKDIIQNMISGYELTPSKKYFDFYNGQDSNHLYPYRNNGQQLDYDQIKSFFTSLGYNTGLFNPSELFHALDNQLINTNGVEIINIAGSGLRTWGQIIEKEAKNLWDKIIQKKDGFSVNGDKTVPLFSASLIDYGNNKSLLGNAKVFYTKQNHGELVASGSALNLVKNVLEENSYLPDGISVSPYSFSGTEFSVYSPVNINIYDSFGNHTGPTINGDFEENIPGSSYETLDDTKFIFLSNDGNYDIKFKATDQGSFDFKIRKYEEDTIFQETLYKDIPLTISTKAETQFNTFLAESPIIHLDKDGDGTADQDVNSSSNLTGNEIFDQISPQTNVQISGTLGNNNWYKSDVLVSLIAEDDASGSGILKTEYSLDNGRTVSIYTEPFVISAEKINKLKFRSIDNAGNEEDSRETEIKIDKTAPEAKISVDPNKQDLVVLGVDANLITVVRSDNKLTKKKDDAFYTITDAAGNSLKLDVREREKIKLDRFGIYSMQYNSDPVKILENNHFNVTYNGKKNRTNVKEQNFELKGEVKMKIKYDVKRNKSTIIIRENKKERVKEVKNGLVLLQLLTNRGQLKTAY